ncbi:pectinesterase-like [Coffea arabica]|uniref:Pectinesterase n=1 Tax=Coffea arabica TaxID=13443 RepID=A0A6P6TMB2_COFAR|nr:pectinesterase-like [Coffea arabica]
MSKVILLALLFPLAMGCSDALPSDFAFNATVSLSRPGAFRKVMDAIAAAPSGSESRYYIHVEAGVYQEIVCISKEKTNIALIGDGADVTKITMNRKVPDFETWETATFCIWNLKIIWLSSDFAYAFNESVYGDGFMAQFIAFENPAGEGNQAVALLSEADQSSFYRCRFLGYHDTLYAKAGAQFYRECDIYGTVDFIFGHAAAVFQLCHLYALPAASEMITFTAQGNKNDGKKSGFVIHNCTLTTAPRARVPGSKNEFNGAYLGRPWTSLSTVIVMQSFLDSFINPAGWLEWPGHSTSTVTYREYLNSGPGAATGGRVPWPGYKVLSQPSDAMPFTVGQFIVGDSWLPETGIPFTSGLF